MRARSTVLRYLLVGAGNISINFGVFFFLYYLCGIGYVLAASAGFAARCLFKFLCLRHWVFGPVRQGTYLPRFALAEISAYLLGTPILIILVELFQLPPPIALLLLIAGMYAAGYLIMRRIFAPESAKALVG